MTFGEHTIYEYENSGPSLKQESYKNIFHDHAKSKRKIELKKDRFTLAQQNENEPFVLHENYDPKSGNNFDVCLIKTSEDIYEVGRNNSLLRRGFATYDS